MKAFIMFIALVTALFLLGGIAVGGGFITQLLLNPILTHFGLTPVTTSICASAIGLIMLFRLLFISNKK